MAVRAGEPGLFVGAAGPAGAFVAAVAFQAQAVLQGRFGIAATAEVEDRLAFHASRQELPAVFANGAVAGFALQSGGQGGGVRRLERRTRERWAAMRRLEDGIDGKGFFLVVTGQAGVGASPGVVALLHLPREQGVVGGRGGRHDRQGKRDQDAGERRALDRGGHGGRWAGTLGLMRRAIIRDAVTRRLLWVPLPVLLGLPTGAAEIDGAELAEQCDECHGEAGRSPEPSEPSIGGFSNFAIEDLLQTYRDGLRQAQRHARADGTETDMAEISRSLSVAETEAVAEHYGAQTWRPHKQPFDAALARRGARIHGVKCAKCHLRGGSVAEADHALLAGQWREYLEAEFANFDSGARRMADKMKKKYDTLSAADKRALLEFYVSAGNF